MKKAIEQVAKLLGNTQAVCRKCYVHPAVLEGCKDEGLLDALARNAPRAARNRPFSLDAHETAVLRLLHESSRRERELARRSGAGGRSLVPVLALAARHLRKTVTTQPAARGASQ